MISQTTQPPIKKEKNRSAKLYEKKRETIPYTHKCPHTLMLSLYKLYPFKLVISDFGLR